ncbi:hypothetical protein QFC19_005153 [Naganishia cerealis]|uniref:Uncharacterized protein n=1 Tax=Naganishia cerealis TaxID=610337 RepID=A0ACC2VPY5_9TREE|nr:hypothetical protein QFC19_005153 [Naganishia cerealis]
MAAALDTLARYRTLGARQSPAVVRLGKQVLESGTRLGTQEWAVREQITIAALDVGDVPLAEALHLESLGKYASARIIYHGLLGKRDGVEVPRVTDGLDKEGAAGQDDGSEGRRVMALWKGEADECFITAHQRLITLALYPPTAAASQPAYSNTTLPPDAEAIRNALPLLTAYLDTFHSDPDAWALLADLYILASPGLAPSSSLTTTTKEWGIDALFANGTIHQQAITTTLTPSSAPLEGGYLAQALTSLAQLTLLEPWNPVPLVRFGEVQLLMGDVETGFKTLLRSVEMGSQPYPGSNDPQAGDENVAKEYDAVVRNNHAEEAKSTEAITVGGWKTRVWWDLAAVESAALAFAGALVSLGYANFFLWFAVLANRTVENAPEVPVDAQDKESPVPVPVPIPYLIAYTPCSRLDPLQIAQVDECSEDNALPRRLVAGRYVEYPETQAVKGKLRDDSTTYASDKEQLLPPLPFQTSLPGLADTMCQALAICARTVDDTYNWSDFARRRQHNLPALVKQFTRPPSSPPGHNETRNINSREQLLAIQHDLESCVAEYETDLLIWLDTDVFSSSATSSNTSTAKCPVAKVSLADMPTASTSARAMMFEQKLQQHATLPGHAGLNNNRRAKIRKTHEARLKATSWLVAMLDLSSDILQLVSTSLQLVERADERGFTDKGMRRSRLWLPKLGKHWLFKAPNKGRLVDDMGASSSAVQKQAELESAEREEGEDVAFIAQHRLARTLTRDERVKHLQRQEDDRRADIAADKAHASEQGELKGRRQPRRRAYQAFQVDIERKAFKA